MSIKILRILIDFGLVVLIWIVQLIIYPSFKFYNHKNLVLWHKKYTRLIACIVGPLMVGQLTLSIYHCIIETQPYQLIKLFFIIIIWVITMLQFVPLHNRITNKDFDHKVLISLNKKNWSRTILWTLIFLLECIFI
ncbi:hypothetical protein SAMN04488007_3496 [Maribacter aquivivus]|uniref:DUF4149 domain-containing protein n=1 Tax=Maribacter aquivivus TaxID=228958 RepID=A0A1M6U5P8_9FLAO|nr:hypothetical protein SAMN04488007_3496 [Maribacter aquivivus]